MVKGKAIGCGMMALELIFVLAVTCDRLCSSTLRVPVNTELKAFKDQRRLEADRF